MLRDFQVFTTSLLIVTPLELITGYDVSKVNMTFVECPIQKVGHSAERGLSFDSCVDNCARKPWCDEIIYNRRSNLCFLCHDMCLREYENTSGKSCVRVHKDTIRDDEVTSCKNDCSLWDTYKIGDPEVMWCEDDCGPPWDSFQTCDPDVAGGCLSTECPPITLWDGELKGNMVLNGSRKKINCTPPFYEIMDRTSADCIGGTWPQPPPFCDAKIIIG